MRKTPQSKGYMAWAYAKKRCYNPKCESFKRYGGRGIAMCDRWRNSSAAFLADMGEPPTSRHSLDRIDGNGNYTPENCRWALPVEQARNRRTNRIMEAFGLRMTATEWAHRAGISTSLLCWRMNKKGMTIEQAIVMPKWRRA